MIKVFTTNNEDKIEFTKDELQRLLQESYNEGYAEGCKNVNHYFYPYWNRPYWGYPYITTSDDTCNTITYYGTNTTGVKIK